MTEYGNAQAAGGRRWAHDDKHMGDVLLHYNTLAAINAGLTSGGTFWPTIKTEPRKLPLSGTPHPTARGIFVPGIRPAHTHTHGFYVGSGQPYNSRKAKSARRLRAVSSLPAPTIVVGAHLSGGRRHG